MSNRPVNPRAQAAFDALTASADSSPLARFTGGSADPDALRELLIALTCPLPCVGEVNDTGWHLQCEARADTALAALRQGLAPLAPTAAPALDLDLDVL